MGWGYGGLVKLILIRERIIVPLYRQFVVYPGVAGVEEGAVVEDIQILAGRTAGLEVRLYAPF